MSTIFNINQYKKDVKSVDKQKIDNNIESIESIIRLAIEKNKEFMIKHYPELVKKVGEYHENS